MSAWIPIAFLAGFMLADTLWRILTHWFTGLVDEQRALINEQGDLIDKMKPFVEAMREPTP